MAIKPIHEALCGVTQFGRLTVLSECDGKVYGTKRHRRALVRCSCGNEVKVDFNTLKKGQSNSCGCLKADTARQMCLDKATHGHSRTGSVSPEYRSWHAMRQRCLYAKHKHFDNYGGRGIAVCARWASFDNFLADMGVRPTVAHTIDRINNDGDYEPGNCRLATRLEQVHNRR